MIDVRTRDIQNVVPGQPQALAARSAVASIIALTHDQGHIAAKTFDFWRTISVTPGIRFLDGANG